MKCNINIAEIKSDTATVKDLDITVEYTAEEMIELLKTYPQIIELIMKQ